MKEFICLALSVCLVFQFSFAQEQKQFNAQQLDSIYIQEVENKNLDAIKVLHAEPLYVDLIRDLGARKGEREWNVGLGLTDNKEYDAYTTLVEYEWAPINRLGLELELPFSFYYPTGDSKSAPGNRLNSIKLATQYTFFVSETRNLSLALGYIHEFELTDFSHLFFHRFFEGNVYNPFLVAAKRWGNNCHTLVYTGPKLQHHFGSNILRNSWELNSSFHYMISGTRNFIGVEFNKSFSASDFDMTIRPQMRVGVNEQLMVGIVTGIPIYRENERFSSFLRLIYEPKHRN